MWTNLNSVIMKKKLVHECKEMQNPIIRNKYFVKKYQYHANLNRDVIILWQYYNTRILYLLYLLYSRLDGTFYSYFNYKIIKFFTFYYIYNLWLLLYYFMYPLLYIFIKVIFLDGRSRKIPDSLAQNDWQRCHFLLFCNNLPKLDKWFFRHVIRF